MVQLKTKKDNRLLLANTLVLVVVVIGLAALAIDTRNNQKSNDVILDYLMANVAYDQFCYVMSVNDCDPSLLEATTNLELHNGRVLGSPLEICQFAWGGDTSAEDCMAMCSFCNN